MRRAAIVGAIVASGVAGLALERQYGLLNRLLYATIWRQPPAPEMTPFQRGWNAFAGNASAERGLGPAYNATSCVSCHHIPTLGGVSLTSVVHVGLRDDRGAFVAPDGGTLLPAFGAPDDLCRRRMPENIAVIARRIATPVFGAGLVEAIADDTLIALEDPDDANGDGIRGRAARVMDAASGQRRVGRFGWKAQHATILSFAADSYARELGITNRVYPTEMPLGVSAAEMADCDLVADPEDQVDPASGMTAIESFTAFVIRADPLPRGRQGDDERNGELLFATTGCASCHRPAIRTAATAAAPNLAGVDVRAYSDFLLHDIGIADHIAQAAAGPREMRTAPLWGLRVRPLLLHDGRATTIEDAIAAHGGEATGARGRFDALAPERRRQLLAFLKSL